MRLLPRFTHRLFLPSAATLGGNMPTRSRTLRAAATARPPLPERAICRAHFLTRLAAPTCVSEHTARCSRKKQYADTFPEAPLASVLTLCPRAPTRAAYAHMCRRRRAAAYRRTGERTPLYRQSPLRTGTILPKRHNYGKTRPRSVFVLYIRSIVLQSITIVWYTVFVDMNNNNICRTRAGVWRVPAAARRGI